jgi:hypothetical protein
MEHLAAWFSPTRFFLEGLAVGEYRCLPPQSGWTVLDESVNNNRFDYTLMHVSQFSFAMHDANATKPSCMGYYWGVLPSIFVGITVRYAAFLAMVRSSSFRFIALDIYANYSFVFCVLL